MTIYAEKRKGVLTGTLIVEVMRQGRVIRHRCETMPQARVIEAQLKAGMTIRTKVPDGVYRVGQFVHDARIVWKGTKTETQSIRRFEKVCSLLGADTPLKEVRTTQLDGVVTKLKKEGLSDSSINRYLASFSAGLKWAKARDHLDDVPVLPWEREGDGRIVYLSESDETRLLDWLRGRGRYTHALAFRVLIVTGLRVGELLGLTEHQVRDDHIHLDDPTKLKSGRARIVPIIPELVEPLRGALREGQLPSYRSLLKAFGKARKALGLDPALTLHGLRHTYASRSDAKGMSPFQIQAVLGHSKIETTLRYVHSMDDALKDSYLRAWGSPASPPHSAPTGMRPNLRIVKS